MQQPPVTSRTLAALALSALGIFAWAVGVQTFEGLASVGMALASAGALLSLKKPESLKEWWPVGAFVGWALLVPTLANRPPNGSGVARTVDWLVLPLGAMAWAQTAPQVKGWVGKAAAAVLLLSCAAAGLQHFGQWPAEPWFASLSWTQLPFHRVYEQVPGTVDRFMGGGLLFHRLKFAHVTALGVLAMIVVGARSPAGTRGTWFFLAAVAGVSVWLFPYARMAAVAMTAAAGVTLVRASQRPGIAALVAVGLGVAAAGIVSLTPALRDRFNAALTAQGSGERLELLETGLRAVEEHPLTGVGPGQFRPAKFADAQTPTLVLENAGKSHFQLLSIAAETGVPGALLFLGMLAFLGWRGRRSALTVGALTFFALLSLAHDPLFQAPFSMALVGVLAVGWVEGNRRSPQGPGTGPE